MTTRCLARCLSSTTRQYFVSALSRASATSVRPLVSATSVCYFRRFSPGFSFRGFATRQTSSSLNDPNPNWSNRPPKETILLDGCDFEHWLVVMEKPENDPTRDEIIDSYIKTLAMVVGSELEARMKIYSVSTRHYFAFGALVSEELSYKLKELPKVRWVLPDSYLDVRNKDYGGEPFINGQAVPYDPKYHEEWVRNNARANERNRRNDRPRNFDRSRNFERRRDMQMNNPNFGGNVGGPSGNMGAPPSMGAPLSLGAPPNMGAPPSMGTPPNMGAQASMGTPPNMGAPPSMGAPPNMGAQASMGTPPNMGTPSPGMPNIGPVQPNVQQPPNNSGGQPNTGGVMQQSNFGPRPNYPSSTPPSNTMGGGQINYGGVTQNNMGRQNYTGNSPPNNMGGQARYGGAPYQSGPGPIPNSVNPDSYPSNNIRGMPNNPSNFQYGNGANSGGTPYQSGPGPNPNNFPPNAGSGSGPSPNSFPPNAGTGSAPSPNNAGFGPGQSEKNFGSNSGYGGGQNRNDYGSNVQHQNAYNPNTSGGNPYQNQNLPGRDPPTNY